MTTLTITLSDEQILSLVKQLSPASKSELFSALVRSAWPEWAEVVNQVQPQARRLAAERGLNWDSLTEEERTTFIDDLIHEDRN